MALLLFVRAKALAATLAAVTAAGDVERGERAIAGARDRNGKLGAAPGNIGPGDRDQDIRRAVLRVGEPLSARHDDRDRSIEGGGDARNVLVEYAGLRKRVFDADEEEIIALLCLSRDRLVGRVVVGADRDCDR